MISIILNWIYVLFVTLTLGFGVAGLVQKLFKYDIRRFDSLAMAGLIVATVYAQIFSLFYKVGLAANIVLFLICLAILATQRKKIIEIIREWKHSSSLGNMVFVVALFVLWAYFTSRGYMHYDSDLYHAQSIRWIEEYGIVPGLGNLHERFAYNSSFFALSALFSMKFMLGTSMHAINGFFAFVLSITCLPIANSFKNKKFSISDYARVGAIYYLTIITNEVVAPVSDIAVMLVIFFIVIKWLDVLGGEKSSANTITPYALLCVVGVYALTLKLTAGLILILLIKPAYQLIKEKRVKEIFIYLAAGLCIAIPWFVRTVVISGWLLYPFTALDLFNVDWKMDAYYVNIDAAQIKTWGRALYSVALIDTPIVEWFPNWFQTTLSSMEKILILGASAATIVVLVLGICYLIKLCRKKNDVAFANYLLVMIALAASYFFWQTSAPLMRYGYAYVVLLSLVVFGYLIGRLDRIPSNKNVFKLCPKVVYVLVLLYGVYKLLAVSEYAWEARTGDYYVWQLDYGVYDVESYEIEGETFYYGAYGDRTGYDSFPSAPTKANITFRGEGMKDGFMPN